MSAGVWFAGVALVAFIVMGYLLVVDVWNVAASEERLRELRRQRRERETGIVDHEAEGWFNETGD